MAEKTPIVWTFRGQGVSFMGDLESFVGLFLSGSALILLTLVLTKYKKHRGMRLALFALLLASSSFRLVRGFLQGAAPSWLDALGVVFFGYEAIVEAIPLIKRQAGRR